MRRAILAAALAVASCAPQCPPGPSPEERAAIAMIRMGYDRWVVACAHTMAKDGWSIEETNKTCRVDFDLPPER